MWGHGWIGGCSGGHDGVCHACMLLDSHSSQLCLLLRSAARADLGWCCKASSPQPHQQHAQGRDHCSKPRMCMSGCWCVSIGCTPSELHGLRAWCCKARHVGMNESALCSAVGERSCLDILLSSWLDILLLHWCRVSHTGPGWLEFLNVQLLKLRQRCCPLVCVCASQFAASTSGWPK